MARRRSEPGPLRCHSHQATERLNSIHQRPCTPGAIQPRGRSVRRLGSPAELDTGAGLRRAQHGRRRRGSTARQDLDTRLTADRSDRSYGLVSPRKFHADQTDIDTPLVRELVATQFPQWATLPLEPVDSSGLVNAIYRLGPELSVRLPLRPLDHRHGATGAGEARGTRAVHACGRPIRRGDRLTHRGVPWRVVRPPLAQRYAPLSRCAG